MGTQPGAETHCTPHAQVAVVQPQLTHNPLGQDSQELQGLQQQID